LAPEVIGLGRITVMPGFVTREDFRAAELAAIGYSLKRLRLENILCSRGHIGKLRQI
jgi:hypothetical protein